MGPTARRDRGHGSPPVPDRERAAPGPSSGSPRSSEACASSVPLGRRPRPGRRPPCRSGATTPLGPRRSVAPASSRPRRVRTSSPARTACRATRAGIRGRRRARRRPRGSSSAASAAPGDALDLHLTSPVDVDVDWYRLGWYDGLGRTARQVDRRVLAAPAGPPAIDRTTGRVEATGGRVLSIRVDPVWPSGAYVAILRPIDGSPPGAAPFIGASRAIARRRARSSSSGRDDLAGLQPVGRRRPVRRTGGHRADRRARPARSARRRGVVRPAVPPPPRARADAALGAELHPLAGAGGARRRLLRRRRPRAAAGPRRADAG